MAKKFLSDIELDAGLVDVNGNTGTSGQILSSTGTAVDWVNQGDVVAGEADKALSLTIRVKNTEAVALTKGQVVCAAPSATPPSGNVIEVKLADNNGTDSMPAIGVLNEGLDAAGGANDEGDAIMFGRVSGIDTSAFAVGDEVFVSDTAGALTATKPTGVKYIQKIGVVIRDDATNGTIEVFGAGRTNDVPTPLYIDHANQRLGIGTESPDAKLDVDGKILATWAEFTTTVNFDPGADDLNVSGFGIQGNRTSNPIYVHNHGNGGVRISSNSSLGSVNGMLVADTFVNIAGDLTVSGGDITLGGTGRIQGIDTVSAGTDAANKTYVDNGLAGKLSTTGKAADSNLLDGIDSDSFLRSDADDTATGTITVSGKDQSFVADYDVSGTNWSGRIISKNDTTGVASFLGNYNGVPGVFAHNSALNAWNSIFINTLATTGNGNANVYTGTLYVNGNTAWHSGNDGSGSGLDADLLDGKQPPTNFAATSQTYTTIASGGWALPTGSSIFSKSDSSGGVSDDGYWFVTGRRDVGGGYSGIYTSHNDGNAWIGYSLTGTANPTWYKLWTAGNDGSGSGLDADLLDGQQGSYYLNYNNFTNTPTIPSPYTHPTHPGDDINLDTGALTGATVISDLDFNVTTDTLGHVTDAKATYSTRNLTASDVGAAPSSHNHNNLYYTESESDSRFVNVTGDTMTGNLQVGSGSADNYVRSYFNDGSYTEMRGYGLQFSRNPSYIRPTADNTKTLYLGSSTAQWIVLSIDASTTTFNTNGSENMRITSAGNVGIGTTSPTSAKFVISGVSTAAYAVDANGKLKIKGDGTLWWGSTADYGKLTWDTGKAIVRGESGKALSLGANGTQDTIYITTSQNVGIGTTSPSEKLDVNGNIKHTGLTMTEGTDVDQIKTFTMTYQLAADTWTDTGIHSGALSTGTYVMQVYVDDHGAGGQHYDEFYSATISWYGSSTNSTVVDEIVVHRAGHAPNANDLQFRTQRASGADTHDLMLQVKANVAHTAAMNNTDNRKHTYKFRRLI